MESVACLRGHKAAVNRLCFGSESSYECIWSASDDKSARLWDLRISGGKAIKAVQTKSAINCISLGANPHHFLIASENQLQLVDLRRANSIVTLVDANNSRLIHQSQEEINDVALLTRNRFVAVDDAGAITVSQFPSFDQDALPPPLWSNSATHTLIVSSVASVGEDLFACGSMDCSLSVWDADSLELEHMFSTGSAADAMVHALAASVDGVWLTAALTNSTILLYDLEEFKLAATLRGHRSMVGCLSFARFGNGDQLLSGGSDKELLVWKFGPPSSSSSSSPAAASVRFSHAESQFFDAELIQRRQRLEHKPNHILSSPDANIFVADAAGMVQQFQIV